MAEPFVGRCCVEDNSKVLTEILETGLAGVSLLSDLVKHQPTDSLFRCAALDRLAQLERIGLARDILTDLLDSILLYRGPNDPVEPSEDLRTTAYEIAVDIYVLDDGKFIELKKKIANDPSRRIQWLAGLWP